MPKITYTCSLCGEQIERNERGHPPNRCKTGNGLWSSCRNTARAKFGREEVTDAEIMDAVTARLERRQIRLEAGPQKGPNGHSKSSRQIVPREAVWMTFNTHDIMRAPTEKAVRMFRQILKRERMFTM